MFKYISVLALIISLTSCGLYSKKYSPESFDFNKLKNTDGIIIISTGAREKCYSFATEISLIKKGEPYIDKGIYSSYNTGVASLNIDAYVYESDYSDHQGILHVLTIPAGEYYIAPRILNPYVSPSKVDKLYFSVRSREISYLGEFFLDASCGVSTKYGVRDKYARDRKLLEKLNPKFKKYDINVNIIQH